MKKLFTLLTAMLCFVVTAFAQNAEALSWNVGSGANDKADITWIGLAVPATEGVTNVALENIHLCTNTEKAATTKTAYMVISSTKNIEDKVAVSTNNPTPVNNALVEYTFEDVTLTAGATYYIFFSESNTSIGSCGQRIAISNANGNYEPKVSAGGSERTWLPYFKVNVADPNAAPAVFSATYGEKWLRLTNCNNQSYTWSAPTSSKAGTAALDMSLENQLFCFVGNNTDGFDIYCKALGQQYKLTASTSPGNGTAASWTTGEAAKWFLNMSQNAVDTKPGIGVTTNVAGNYSLNMYGGNGGDLKFYGITDAGSRWSITRVNPNAVNVRLNVTGETKYPQTNTRIGDFKLTYGSTTSTTTITKDLNGEQKTYYFPHGEKVSMSTFTYHGWNASIVEGDNIEYTIDKVNGNLYRDGTTANQNWNNVWKSTEVPQLTFGCGANNMNWAGNTVQLMSGQTANSTYTLTVPEGYRIEEYSFTFANNNHDTGLTLTFNGTAYTTSNDAQTIASVNENLASLQFTLAGTNSKGVLLTNFTVKLKPIVNVNFTGDMESEYQYLWYHNNPPYRIPAIATRKDGKLLALNDYRPCGADIGFGRVDLVQRIGSADGTVWGEGTTIITGNVDDNVDGDITTQHNDGYGDPAVCIDRETGRVLLICVTGRTVCGSATRENPNRIARFYSEDGGETYHSVNDENAIFDDITEEFYGLWDTEAYKAGDKTSQDQYTAQSFFFGSGRIFQSSKIKVGEYYRIYAALWSKDMHNRVAYSDDFGLTWNILGTREDMPFPNFGNANEPKCEELPNGDVIMSSRKPHGRYYNIFTYTDVEKGQGSWGEGTNSDIPAPSDWNGTNGEITTLKVLGADGDIHNIVLQSLPLGLEEHSGDVRRNVGFYFKDITSKYSYQKGGKNDVPTFATGWERGMLVSTAQGSAYSTFTLQKDGRIGFFYEETPGGYSMVYVPLTISQITNGKYVEILGNAEDTGAVPVNITYSYRYGNTEWLSQKEVAYVGEAFPPVLSAAFAQTSGTPEGVATAEDEGRTFVIECELEDMPFKPSSSYDMACWYSLKIRSTKNVYYDEATSKFACNATTQSGDKTLFAFVGNPFTGYRIVNRALGNSKAIGGAVSNNAHVSAVDYETAPVYMFENNSGHLVFRNASHSLGYLNDVNSNLGYWTTDAAATDGGSSLTFTLESDIHELNVGDAGYATLYLGFNAAIPANVEAYVVSEINNGYVTLEQVTGVLPAEEAVIVKAAKGNYGFAQSSDTPAAVECNLLKGTLEDTNIYGDAYVLGFVDGEAGLYKAELNQEGGLAFLNNANKAYLPAPEGSQEAASYSFRFPGTTGVEEVKVENVVKGIYDLQGRKVLKPVKGIYIINGKKVLVK